MQNAQSDHPAHAQSIIRAFAFHSYIHKYPMILLADSEGPAQSDQGLHCPHIGGLNTFCMARP